MIALMRYQLTDLRRSQQWVAPLLVYVVFLGMFYASEPGPAVPAWGASGFVLFPIAAWLTRQQLSVEDDVAREVSAAAAGGLLRVQSALLCSAAVAQFPLVLLAVGWAVVANRANVHTASQIAGGVAVHLVFAIAGIGLGAIAARPIMLRPGAAALTIVGAVIAALLIEWSPAFQAERVLQRNPVHHFRTDLIPWLAALAALGVLCACASLVAAARD